METCIVCGEVIPEGHVAMWYTLEIDDQTWVVGGHAYHPEAEWFEATTMFRQLKEVEVYNERQRHERMRRIVVFLIAVILLALALAKLVEAAR